MKRVIFTDLDGTLLDRSTYSYHQALEAISLLKRKDVPLVFCSTKTRAEQELYRNELNIQDPFIVENGGAIFIPRDYFTFSFDYHKATKEYFVVELGISHHKVREILRVIEQETGCRIRGFGDMSVEEIARDSGLSPRLAALAKQREYDETFKIEDTSEKTRLALARIVEAGLSYTHGGIYYDATGGNDKGKATRISTELFKNKLGQIETIGIGDNQNDIPMLKAVDIPVLVQKPDHSWGKIDLPNVYKAKGVGPQGWSRAIYDLIGG